jgi:hypothetical protein
MWIAIHKYMEATLGSSLYSSLYLRLAKMPCFSFYLSCFFFFKIREQESKIGSAWRQGRESDTRGEGGGSNVHTCMSMQK